MEVGMYEEGREKKRREERRGRCTGAVSDMYICMEWIGGFESPGRGLWIFLREAGGGVGR